MLAWEIQEPHQAPASFQSPHSQLRRNRKRHELIHQMYRYNPCSPSNTLARIGDSYLGVRRGHVGGSHPVALPPNFLVPVANWSCWSTALIPLSPVTHPMWLLKPPYLSRLPAIFNRSPVPKSPCLSYLWAWAPAVLFPNEVCPTFRAPSLPSGPSWSLQATLVFTSSYSQHSSYGNISQQFSFHFTFQKLSIMYYRGA